MRRTTVAFPVDTNLGLDTIAFETVYARALWVPLEHTEAIVVSLDDPITLKRQAGRPRDQEDVAALEALRHGAIHEAGEDEYSHPDE